MGKDQCICLWCAGQILTASIRKLFHNPQRILTPHLTDGMTAIDIGCGMGFFTLPMADIVGRSGHIIAVDMQSEMLEGLKKNAEKAGVNNIMRHQETHGDGSFCSDNQAFYIDQLVNLL